MCVCVCVCVCVCTHVYFAMQASVSFSHSHSLYYLFQSLTGGNGFYAVDTKENLWLGRRLVVRDKETGN